MCDTVVSVGPRGVLFAKNSDRDANEAQLLEWHPRHEHPSRAQVRCTWISIPQVQHTHAVLLSRPFWMWGAEMGTNEHGVTIGNEAVFTRAPYAASGLTGMDLLRLALERAASAREAVEVICGLLEAHGQGGGCGHEDRGFTYHNAFLIADARGAFVLDTAGRHWAVEEVQGVRSISNALSIPGFAERWSDRLKTSVAQGRARRLRTESQARGASSAADMMRVLRDHGAGRSAPRYAWLNGTMDAPCMHGGGLVVGSVTTGSLVSELRPDGVAHWATGTSAPCLGLFKPVRVGTPLDLGPLPGEKADPQSLWWRHERIHRAVARDYQRLAPPLAEERDAVERAWLASPPEPQAAFAEGDRLLSRWQARLDDSAEFDRRPVWTRGYWRKRARLAS